MPTTLPMYSLHAPVLLALLSTFALAGCNDRQAAAPAAPSPVVVAVPAAGGTGDHFSCDANVTVVVTNKVAQANLPDGRQVKLALIADSTPPVFAGSALYFRLDGARAHLSQDVGPELACHPDDQR